MQDITIGYDETLPVPYLLIEADGYVRVQANPRYRTELPLWLLEVMANDIFAHVTIRPASDQPSIPSQPVALGPDVIDITAARRKRAG